MAVSITTAKHIHFTGIKGVGMTAAALCVSDLGIPVSGSDVPTDFVTTTILKQRHIKISFGFEPELIPPATDLLVYTAAHQGKNNPQVQAALKRGIRAISHAEAVGELMAGKFGISVCGVGGKTTISAMLATILDYSGLKPSYLVGVGKILNLQAPGRMDTGTHFIAEADEYVVSPQLDHTPRFLFQTPSIIVCTNIIHDHPDVYPDIDATKKAYLDFFDRLPADGLLIINGDSPVVQDLNLTGRKLIYYGHTSVNNHWWLKDAFIGEAKQLVEFSADNESIRLTLSIPGAFNALNALAAFLVAREIGVKTHDIVKALQLFRGSMRRFEKKAEVNGIRYYDDYAHHPTEIEATLEGARKWLPLNRIVVAFQPHTYSRTKALLTQFSTSFPYADHVIITDIYASEREAPDPSITGELLASEVSKHHPSAEYVKEADLVEHLKNFLKPGDAFFTIGAGNIYQIHELIIPYQPDLDR